MGKIIKLYNTWEKAKQVFVKPSLKVYFGKWRNDPNLPAWRMGALIYVCRRKHLSKYCHLLKDAVMIQSGTSTYKCGDKEYSTKCYSWVPKHKLPGKLKAGQYVWNRNIRKKLKRWHLSWIPPIIQLPLWTRFYLGNFDLGWKIKWDDVRYEFPPQFTISAFGLSLSLTLHSPYHDTMSCDNHYWESILNHAYKNKSGKLRETIELTGIWQMWNQDGKDIKYFALRPEYIKKEYKEEYYAAVSDIKRKKEEVVL